jgi:nitroimidazol reductase NimA-like FMN-containing flavoprotein (pyridoxamine 5'-phosphate oxidase superfamily)
MNPIRYAKRTCTNQEHINAFLAAARVGHLGLTDGLEPYVVPLNFCWLNGSVYFHGAEAGRKTDIMQKNNRVCFTVCEEYGTIADPVPALTDTAYMSVILFGSIERVEDPEEMRDALQAMLDKYVPGYYDRPLPVSHVVKYRSSMGSAAAVFRIRPDRLTAKANPLSEAKRFSPGRTHKMDV